MFRPFHAFLNDPVGDRVRFATAPEVVLGSAPRGNTPPFVDTGALIADESDVWGVEAAWVHGPLSVQAEYARACVDRLLATDVAFPAGYVLASWFLTGGHRTYDRTLGAFGRPMGNDAFELTARFSFIDLEDQDVRGRTMDDWTAGLNWHLNPNARLLFNVVRSHTESSGATLGRATALGAQAVYDF